MIEYSHALLMTD